MWPWEHLAIGYLVASTWHRLDSRRSPGDAEALAVLFGTQFPDLVDKPLGWGTTLIPSGRSLAHALPFALTVSAAVYLVTRRYGRPQAGVAFALGYLAHLPADAIYPLIVGGDADWQFLLWPFVPLTPSHPDAVVGHVLELVVLFVEFLGTPRGLAFLVAELTLLAVTAVLWWRDGWPGLGPFRDAVGV